MAKKKIKHTGKVHARTITMYRGKKKKPFEKDK